MKSSREVFIFILTLVFAFSFTKGDSIDDATLQSSGNSSYELYNFGVERGIIDTEKYTFDAFVRDEKNVFHGLYKEFSVIHSNVSMSYEDWLILNNFGVLPDTKESLFQRKIMKRSTADNKRKFVSLVKKGDILITGRGKGGLIGHAAIMTTDYWVLEMPGGTKGLDNGIKDNNRQIPKDKWFDEHASDWTTVYRNRNDAVAHEAAVWADHNYYNPSGGVKKTLHITYKISDNLLSTNPSYCSKLVIHAYYFGTGNKRVINLRAGGTVIVPSTIPAYFLPPYTLVNKGKY